MSSPDAHGAGGHWSDGETWALIEAWGPMYLGRKGGFIREGEWRQVCDAVNAHRAAAGRRFNRNIVQCQYRLYALKAQYKKELAKGQPTSGWRHFAQLRAFLADPDNGPASRLRRQKMPSASVKKEEVVEDEEAEEKEGEDEASDGASGSVGRKTVPAKRQFSSIQNILHRSGGPAPGFPPRMPATAKKQKVEGEVEVKEEVDREGPASAGCNPVAVVTKLAAVTTKLAEVYERVEMEMLSVEKEKMAMEREKRTAKMEAENLGETD